VSSGRRGLLLRFVLGRFVCFVVVAVACRDEFCDRVRHADADDQGTGAATTNATLSPRLH
jgi:hypothetical protein